MKACKKRIGGLRPSRESLLSYRPLTSCDYTTNLIPLTEWIKSNNFSYRQATRLIKRKKLIAKRYKHRWYVAPTPYFIEEMRSLF